MKNWKNTTDFLREIPLPEQTRTYKPVSHAIFIDEIKEELYKRGHSVKTERYLTANNGLIMTGNFTVDNPDSHINPAIFFTNSYNKMRKAELMTGAIVLVCSNGLIRQEVAHRFSKKHSGTVLEDLRNNIVLAVESVEEEFEKLKNEIFNGSVKSWLDAKNKFEEIVKKAPKKYLRILKSENSIGDHIYNSKNCINCFDAHEIEDAYNSASLGDSKDVYSSYSVGWPRSELIYYSSVVRSSQKCAFCKYIWQSSDLFYCDSCISCKNCFGCIGLKHKEYCILNKQYSQEEYLHLIAKIIAHMKSTNEWGKFFPQSISPFSYNETAAYDFFPLSKEEAIARGYLWKEAEKKDISVQSSTNDILMCDSCKKNYKLIVQELKFYKKKGLPEPVNCPNCRHKERFGKRNKYEIYKTTCNKCNTQIFTTFPPANGNVVYCEKCYQEDIN